jgi:hypothetical protein
MAGGDAVIFQAVAILGALSVTIGVGRAIRQRRKPTVRDARPARRNRPAAERRWRRSRRRVGARIGRRFRIWW